MTTTRPPAPREPHISVLLADSAGRVVFARDAERRYYAASTMKLAVLLAATVRIAQGDVTLDQELLTTRTFTGADGSPFTLSGDHLDPQLPPPGTPIVFADLLEAMIVRSSNEATNSVIELIGLPAVGDLLPACSTRHTRIERLIGDPAAVSAGLSNQTSAGDLVVFMRAIVTGQIPGFSDRLPGTLTDFARNCLERQTIAPIGAALPREVRWGSKSGEVDGIRHDVAFIGDPASDSVHYLSVCTQGLGEAAANEAIATVTEALLPQFLH